MSENRKLPAEYNRVPELPATREFVYWYILEYFNIHEESQERPDGLRRGSRHAASINDFSDSLLSRLDEHNRSAETKIKLARATVPKVLQELSILGNANYSYAYDRMVYVEAHVYTPKNDDMTKEELEAAGYKEEHAGDVFRYSPSK